MDLRRLVVVSVAWTCCAVSAKEPAHVNSEGVDLTLARHLHQPLQTAAQQDTRDIVPGLLQLKRKMRQVEPAEDMVVEPLEELATNHLLLLQFPRILTDAASARQSYRRVRRFLLPLLIGVVLKLATFVPFALSLLTLLGKTAFLAGHLSVFLSGLTIFLKYFYPKLDYKYEGPPHGNYHKSH